MEIPVFGCYVLGITVMAIFSNPFSGYLPSDDPVIKKNLKIYKIGFQVSLQFN